MIRTCRLTVACVILAWLLTAVGQSAAGPLSRLYLSKYDGIVVVQEDSILNSWFSWSALPIAVGGGYVRTGPTTGGQPGAEYTTAGIPTGRTYPWPGGYNYAQDGTTDGRFNYLIDFSGGVWQLGLDWSNGQLLFVPSSGTGIGGITYDPTNDSLWLAEWNGNRILNYAKDGTLLSAFTTSLSAMTSLARDPADGTLWVSSWNTYGLYQFSTSGDLLDVEISWGIPSMGGEFEYQGQPPVPEPSSLALVGIGAVGVMLGAAIRRKRK